MHSGLLNNSDSNVIQFLTRLSFEVFSLGKTLDFLDQNCFSDTFPLKT